MLFWILYISVSDPVSFLVSPMRETLVPLSREEGMNDKRRMDGRVGLETRARVAEASRAHPPREAVVPVEEAARPSWGPISHQGGRGWLLDTAGLGAGWSLLL